MIGGIIVAVLAVLWAAGAPAAGFIEYRNQRVKRNPEYVGVWMFTLFPLCWLAGWFAFFEPWDEMQARHLEEKRRRLTGQDVSVPNHKDLRALRRSWDHYYEYMGEVKALGDDFIHPDIPVTAPKRPDPRGVIWPKHRSDLDYYDRWVDAGRTECWPEPSTRRLSKLLDTARPVTLEKKKEREFQALEAYALGETEIPPGDVHFHRKAV